MAARELVRIEADTADAVCRRFDLDEEAARLLRPGLTPTQYLEALEKKRLYGAAVRFLAHALPKREAVWWACVCARSSAGASRGAAALRAAEAWVANPSEENRRAAFPAAFESGVATAAGSAALAAFASGGSLTPHGAAPVSPPEALTSETVAGALMYAAADGAPGETKDRLCAFLEEGRDIAAGVRRWTAPR